MPEWKKVKLSVTLESAEEAELFLKALVHSRTAHSSEWVEALVEATAEALEPYRAAVLLEQVAEREEAAKSW